MEHLSIFSDPDHTRQLKGTARNIRNQPLHALRIVCGNLPRVVDAESRGRPSPHRSHNLLIDLFLMQQQIKHPVSPHLCTSLHIHPPDQDIKSVPFEQPLANDRVHMAVPADEIAKCLNRPHITGLPLPGSACLAQPIPDHFIGQPAQFPQ